MVGVLFVYGIGLRGGTDTLERGNTRTSLRRNGIPVDSTNNIPSPDTYLGSLQVISNMFEVNRRKKGNSLLAFKVSPRRWRFCPRAPKPLIFPPSLPHFLINKANSSPDSYLDLGFYHFSRLFFLFICL